MVPHGMPSIRVPDGRAVARHVRMACEKIRARLAGAGLTPTLALVQVGRHPVAQHHLEQYAREADAWGIAVEEAALPGETPLKQVVGRLRLLGRDRRVHGIVLLRPLPAELPLRACQAAIAPAKDVEGVHPETRGLLHLGRASLLPAPAAAALHMLDAAAVPVSGREVVLLVTADSGLAASAPLLLDRGAVVTTCCPETPDLSTWTRRGEVLLVDVGRALSVGAAAIRPRAFVVDAGVHARPDASSSGGLDLVGDVDPGGAARVGAVTTPVPGGLASAALAVVLANTLRAALGPPPRHEPGQLPLFES